MKFYRRSPLRINLHEYRRRRTVLLNLIRQYRAAGEHGFIDHFRRDLKKIRSRCNRHDYFASLV